MFISVCYAGCTMKEIQSNSVYETEASLYTDETTDVSQTVFTEKTDAKTENTTETQPSQKLVTEMQINDFKSKLFVVGDSIAMGYSYYERLPSRQVFAQQSATLLGINELTFDSEYGEAYITDIISAEQPEYLVILIGLNEIANKDPQSYAERYREFAEEIHNVSPDTLIMASAITPVSYEDEYINNENINNHNKVISETFTGENNIYYVSPGTKLALDDGSLDPEYAGGDGIHLSGSAYDILLNELYLYVTEMNET